ncbi:branched-chain amino acid ABC transporter permease [Bordetella petrii]|nr:branched-chain amino acid ABC transporter permease [Bordetella petrii]
MLTQLFFAQVLTGIATGALYFLVASGLTLVWGALGVVNLAHGSFFMVAAFSATTIIMQLGANLGLPVALIVVPLLIMVLSVVLEVSLFRRVYESGIWGQLLLTFGLVLVINNLTRSVFGSLPRSAEAPDLLRGFIEIGGIRIAQYQVAVVVVTAIVSVGLWYLLSKSRTGRLIRAAVDDPAMLGAVGVDVKVLRTRVMAISALLAGIAGVVAAPRGAVNATLDVQMVVIAFAIIVIGGLGSVWGALTAAVVVGVAEAVSTIFIDQGSEVVIFALMVIVLFVRPSGLRTIIQH